MVKTDTREGVELNLCTRTDATTNSPAMFGYTLTPSSLLSGVEIGVCTYFGFDIDFSGGVFER